MWYLNVFLYLLFASCQNGGQQSCSMYAAFVANGAPCYAWHSTDGSLPTVPAPACYDPRNNN